MFLKPDYIFSDITQIKQAHLDAIGVKGIIFDLDNTIVPPHSGRLQAYVSVWLEGVKSASVPFIIVTNNHDKDYMKQNELLLGVPVLGPAKKPSGKMIREALEWLKLPAEQVVLIGDRPLTDIWGGQRAGCKTILVDPLMRANEHGHIHLLRALERLPVCVPANTKEKLYTL